MKAKKNIYLVQVDILRRLPTHTTAYLPYGVGQLWAYARQAAAVAESYALGEIFFLREPAVAVAARMEDPFLVGFSCYCWNTEYNKALAQAVKRLFPNCHILFGGHNVPPGAAMLEELPYVDFLIHGEGEIGFQALLAQLAGEAPDFTRAPGLSYRNPGLSCGDAVSTNAEAAPESVAQFPSPYLEGIFDPLVAAHPEMQWSTVWETNRGCPHHCAYCDWGQHKARVRQFSMERLLAEVEWIGANRVGFIWCADANYGILPRDEEILDALVAVSGRTGYPQVFFTQTTKTVNDRVMRIFDKLFESGLEKQGPNFAVQSLSPAVLRNIGRENLTDETIAASIRRCRRAGYRTHTDLIIGLPGETLQSFCAGVEKLYALGQHDGIQYFPCSLLPNAFMATPAYREKHGIRATRQTFLQAWEDAPEGYQVTEYIDTVIETAAMPHADWLTANFFMLLAQGVHAYGLTRLLAMLLHTEGIASYADFYQRLLAFCHEEPDSLFGDIMARVERKFTDGVHGKEPEPLELPGTGFGSMIEAPYIFGRAVLEAERFWADTETFLRRFALEPGLRAQLMRYQRESILLPGEGGNAAGEKILDFDYDFPAYFSAIYDGDPAPLQKRAVRLRFSSDSDISTLEKYYNVVVRRSYYSNGAFYRTEYLPAEVANGQT